MKNYPLGTNSMGRIWRSLKFCKNGHCSENGSTLLESIVSYCVTPAPSTGQGPSPVQCNSAISPSLLTVEHLKENLIHLNGVKTDQKWQRKQQSIVSYTMNTLTYRRFSDQHFVTIRNQTIIWWISLFHFKNVIQLKCTAGRIIHDV